MITTHNQVWILAESDSLVGRKSTSDRDLDAFMNDPNGRESFIFPKYPIYRQAHPGLVVTDDCIFGILPLLELSYIGPGRQCLASEIILEDSRPSTLVGFICPQHQPLPPLLCGSGYHPINLGTILNLPLSQRPEYLPIKLLSS